MPGATPRIVVVEDDASMSVAIERILRVGGFPSVSFASAESALEAGVGTMSDVLVLDIQLPGISGLELYRRLTDARDKLPVIFITSHDEATVRQEAVRLGARNYLAKPFSGRELLQAISDALPSALPPPNRATG